MINRKTGYSNPLFHLYQANSMRWYDYDKSIVHCSVRFLVEYDSSVFHRSYVLKSRWIDKIFTNKWISIRIWYTTRVIIGTRLTFCSQRCSVTPQTNMASPLFKFQHMCCVCVLMQGAKTKLKIKIYTSLKRAKTRL